MQLCAVINHANCSDDEKRNFCLRCNVWELEDSSSAIPTIEATVRYGITKRWDLGGRFDAMGNMHFDTKVQFIGNRKSMFAASTGAGISHYGSEFGSDQSIIHLLLPLYISYYPAQTVGLYCSPRYVQRIMNYDKTDNSSAIVMADFVGSAIGVRLGERWAFVAEYSFLNNIHENEVYSQISVGVVCGIN